MSGNTHRDWGNFTIMRSWQGKVILMALIVPLVLLYFLRFHLYGRRADLVRMNVATCCGIVLSGTGLFLIPFVIGVSAAAVWLLKKCSFLSLRRACLSVSTFSQALFVSILPWFGLLPQLGDISFFISGGWPRDHLDNLAMVFDAQSLPLYLLYITTAFFVRKRKELLSFI